MPDGPAERDYLRDLSSLAARSFASLDEALEATLRAITDHLGVRTSYVTRIGRAAQPLEQLAQLEPAAPREPPAALEVLAARNLPGGSAIEAGATAPLRDTY